VVAAAKFLVAATKILSVIPNFVAATKPFFPCIVPRSELLAVFEYSSHIWCKHEVKNVLAPF